MSGVFRADIIKHVACDIYAISESHLVGDATITVDGYQWFGHNRSNLNPNAIRGSGGVGFLVSNTALGTYTVHILDQSREDVLWVKLQSKSDDEFAVILCVCYLPPEGSSRGDNAQEFYDSLLTQVYMYHDGNPMVISGDLNGRLGSKADYDGALDGVTIPPRIVIDTTCNKYGDYLVDFLVDSRYCVVNGRGDKSCDNYTSVSKKGKSAWITLSVPKCNCSIYPISP